MSDFRELLMLAYSLDGSRQQPHTLVYSDRL